MLKEYAANNYYSHDLNIAMRTSSGDVIKMDFSNQNSSSLSYEKTNASESLSASFSSMQSFKFSIDSNGIDAQDKKEIAAFMKKAQPLIDKFLQEFSKDAPNTPVTKLAKQIVTAFDSQIHDNKNKDNYIKTNIVKAFDKALQKFKSPEHLRTLKSVEDIFKETQKLLEKVLKEFDNFNKELYA